MLTPLQSVLSGARYTLSQQSDDDDQPATGNTVSSSDSGASAKPPSQVAPPKPAPKPAPESIQTVNESEKSGPDASPTNPKRIAFPSGVVVEVPGDWNTDAINEFARTVHAASQKASGSPLSVGNGNEPEGMITPGNLNLNGRPIIKNADGTISSEYSFSFGDENGHEVLVPTVVNGRFLTADGKKPKEGSPKEKAMFKRAQEHYEKTGDHLGIFDTPEHSDAYAEKVHNRPKSTTKAPMYILR